MAAVAALAGDAHTVRAMMTRTLLASALTVLSLGIGGPVTASEPSAAERNGREYKSQGSAPQTDLRQAVYAYSRASLVATHGRRTRCSRPKPVPG